MSNKQRNISVIGAGSWGSALSLQLVKNGHSVKMWSNFSKEIEEINQNKVFGDKFPNIEVPDGIYGTIDIEEAVHGADAILIVIPSQTIRENIKKIANYIKKDNVNDTVMVCCSKGLEEGSCLRLTEVIAEEFPGVRTVVLSGPSHAEEVMTGIPTTIVSASADIKAAEFVQDVFMSPNFRVYTNPDVIGVELGGAIKNVIALCAGISDGLGFGDNTKAALMTRGMAEIARLGIALGARRETFSGLSGIGDLIVTCTSIHSRNRRAGILIGQGKTVSEALSEVKMVVEGVTTSKAAYDLAMSKNVSMPITEEAYKILFQNKDAKVAVADLMMRNKKCEIGDLVEECGW